MIAIMLALAEPSSDIESRLPLNMRWSHDDTPAVVVEKTVFRYDLCIFSAARRFARTSTENATTISDAAFGECSEFAQLYRRSIVAMTPSLLPEMIDQLIDGYRTRRREMIIADVLNQRAKPRR